MGYASLSLLLISDIIKNLIINKFGKLCSFVKLNFLHKNFLIFKFFSYYWSKNYSGNAILKLYGDYMQNHT